MAKVTEAEIQHDIREALGKEPDLVLWRNNTGALKDINGRLVKYGLVEGGADLIGILTLPVEDDVMNRVGVFFALEVKAPGSRTDRRRREAQTLFRELVLSMGGCAAEVSSVDDAKDALQRARAGIFW